MEEFSLLHNTNRTGNLPFLPVLLVRLSCNLGCFPTVRMDDFFFSTYNFSFQSFRLKDRTHVIRYIMWVQSQNDLQEIQRTRDITQGSGAKANISEIQTVFIPHGHHRSDLFRNFQRNQSTQWLTFNGKDFVHINSKSWAGFGEKSPINTKRKYIAKNIKVCIMFLRVSKLWKDSLPFLSLPVRTGISTHKFSFNAL